MIVIFIISIHRISTRMDVFNILVIVEYLAHCLVITRLAVGFFLNRATSL